MNERVRKLREQSLNAVPSVSLERAKLLTDFYKSSEREELSIPVQRAMAFKYLLENKIICINDGELIVGDRGPSPKATPTYPEICIHSGDDLDILNSREKVSFSVKAEDKELHLENILPFWKGRSMREKIFDSVSDEWKDAYAAGIFTEFQEQRAPGHTVLDDKIYKKGMNDFRMDIADSIQKLNSDETEKLEELKAMDICCEALISFGKRYSEKLKELASRESDHIRRDELEEMAKICGHVPANPSRTFHEALQYYWFVHLGVITELNTWDSFNPGRLDLHLYPFYKKGIEDGSLTKEKAVELLQCFWIKFNNQPAPPKVGVTALESNTYTDFCLINVGGLNSNGEDASNELSYIILDVIEEMRLLQPSSMVQISSKSPDSLLDRAMNIIKTGYGQPSLFNSDTIVDELVRQGKDIADARHGGASGCVESGAFGKESYILTGYFNFPKVLEITLHNGVDPKTGKLIGRETGDSASFLSFEELFEAFSIQLSHFLDIKIKENLIIEELWAENLPAPFMSVLIDDCISEGTDYNCGGARYNSSYIQGVGLGSVTDALTSLKFNVFDEKRVSLPDFIKVLKTDYEGYEDFRKDCLNRTPKYGNDDDYADEQAKLLFEVFFSLVDGKPNYKGGQFRINLLPTTCHVYFGSVTGATPDGRKAGTPLSEGISPVQGADRKGPTAVLKSASKIDHKRTGGTLLNQKFTPDVLNDDGKRKKVSQLVRSYFSLGGHHIQFNCVTADTLRKAQASPDEYRDLIVRVAGYSDYFADLGKDLQDEIIKRTEQN